jgi:uncharacterized protein YwqG
MFANSADARAAFERAIKDFDFDEDEEPGDDALDAIVTTLQPCLRFVPAAKTRPGMTRLGGRPDLPEGSAWPIRPAAVDAKKIAKKGGTSHSDHIRAHLSQPVPFVFLGQVDLAEAAKLGGVAKVLPPTGRLLFFCDTTAVPSRDSPESCHVLWDQSPVSTLSQALYPPELEKLAQAYLQKMAEIHAEVSEEYGGEPDPVESHPYYGPPQPMRLEHAVVPLAWGNLELKDSAELQARLSEEVFKDYYYDTVSSLNDREDVGADAHRLLGPPMPVQNDPRIYAAWEQDLKLGPMTSKVWKRNEAALKKAASRWVLLLQVDLAAFYKDRTVPGTVYILIPAESLAQRDFAKACSVYQQT